MHKNIIGNWGSDLSDGDYACALAALGVLESRGTEQHPASREPHEIAAALAAEFEDGERTPVWRAAQNVGPHTTTEHWQETRHTAAAALAAGWRLYAATCNAEPRRQPRLAMPSLGRRELFDDDALHAWLRHPDVGLTALIEALPFPPRPRVRWHWPLRVGVLPEGDDEPLLVTLQDRQNKPDWALRLAHCYEVGGPAHLVGRAHEFAGFHGEHTGRACAGVGHRARGHAQVGRGHSLLQLLHAHAALAQAGGLQAAVAHAAELAKLGTDYSLAEYPGKKEIGEVFKELFEESGDFLSRDRATGAIARRLRAELRTMHQFNDPRHVYLRLPFDPQLN